jgi:hypothetical protein
MHEDPTGQANNRLQTLLSIKKNTAEEVCENSLIKKFPPKDNEKEAESERISASNIFSILTA